jgi:hypothetical protein
MTIESDKAHYGTHYKESRHARSDLIRAVTAVRLFQEKSSAGRLIRRRSRFPHESLFSAQDSTAEPAN